MARPWPSGAPVQMFSGCPEPGPCLEPALGHLAPAHRAVSLLPGHEEQGVHPAWASRGWLLLREPVGL